jgi:hypothetical protein
MTPTSPRQADAGPEGPLEEGPIILVREQRCGPRKLDERDLGEPGLALDGAADAVSQEPVNALAIPHARFRQELERRRSECRVHLDLDAGLLRDLADCCVLRVLVALEMALGKRPLLISTDDEAAAVVDDELAASPALAGAA